MTIPPIFGAPTRASRNLLGAVVAIAALAFVAVGQASAQSIDDERALALVREFYETESTLRREGQSVLDSPTTASAYLSSDAAERAAGLDGPIDPLTGGPSGPIERFDLRPGTAPAPDLTRVEAAVLSGGQARLVRLDLAPFDNDQLRIVDLSGPDWSLAELAPPAAAEAAGSLFDSLDAPTAADESEPAQDAATATADDAAGSSAATASASVPPAMAFTDTFDGTALDPRWTVVNENPDSYVLDNGAIFTIASGGDDNFITPDAANLFQLSSPLGGDFDAALDFKLDSKTGFDGVTLGSWASESDFIAAHAYVFTKGCGSALYLDIVNLRTLVEEEPPTSTRFSEALFDGPFAGNICTNGRAYGDAVLQALAEEGARLTLSRRGYRYTARLDMALPQTEEVEGRQASYETRAISRLTPPGPITFMLDQWRQAGNGEGTALFETFTLEPAG